MVDLCDSFQQKGNCKFGLMEFHCLMHYISSYCQWVN